MALQQNFLGLYDSPVITSLPTFDITSRGLKLLPDGRRNRTVVISAIPGDAVQKSAMETLDLVDVNSGPPTSKQSYDDLIIRIQSSDLKLFSRKIDTSYSSPFCHKSVNTRSHVKTKFVAENVSLPRSVVRYGRLWTLVQQACQVPIRLVGVRPDDRRFDVFWALATRQATLVIMTMSRNDLSRSI
ncbi:hypothetical protein SCHPADRAFT_895476 [Schizopora paradoxa]|uniref:Uncharacterized protein n=1 Tax=Schizopora paradoxa TaxID=27342 RepID=A0A0H2RA62_9AGAM|nr:hypothetical protein SCHPADRAFT_895476 [Schizopora paradoxa]